MKTGDTFRASFRPNGPVVLWRILTDPAEEGGRGPLYVWAEPIRPLCGRGVPAEAVFFCRNIHIEAHAK